MRASVRVSRKSNPSLRYLGHGVHLVIIWYFIYLPIHTTYFSFYFVFGFVYGKWITSELKLRNCGNETINATVKVKASRERKMCVCVCDWVRALVRLKQQMASAAPRTWNQNKWSNTTFRAALAISLYFHLFFAFSSHLTNIPGLLMVCVCLYVHCMSKYFTWFHT